MLQLPHTHHDLNTTQTGAYRRQKLFPRIPVEAFRCKFQQIAQALSSHGSGAADVSDSVTQWRPQQGFGPQLTDLTDFVGPALPATPDLGGRSVLSSWNPVHLAFLGDSVWELFVRNRYFSPPTRLKQYYEECQAQVRAETQALYYEMLLSSPLLTADEREVLRWGHNAKVIAPKRLKHVDTYKRATALECLIGYLYLTDTSRLQQLVHYLLKA